MPKLYVLSGADLGKSFDAGAGALIGRGGDCAVHLRDPSVSRSHARLEMVDGQWSVVDVGSRNGLSQSGARVARIALADGAEFQVGEVLLRFRSDVAKEVAAAHEPPASSAAPRSAHAPIVPEISPAIVEEIELEGEWSTPGMAPASGSRPAAADIAATAFAPVPRALDPAPAPREPAQRIHGPFEQPVATRAAAPTVAARGAGSPSRGILQYRREPDRRGFFSADLAQQPVWVRAAVWVLALAFFAGLFWVAFSATSYLKSRARVEAVEVDGETR